MPGLKRLNEYQGALSSDFYRLCPKAVFAAIAVSLASDGGDSLEEAEQNIKSEWWILYQNGIVPQKPFFPEVSAVVNRGEHDH